jgi:hypothetical protein
VDRRVTTADWILIVNAVAILCAPVVALWIGGILQRRSDVYRNKLSLFGTILALRYDPFSPEAVRSLNSIDAVFADDPAVREAWTKFFAALNDPALNAGPGFSIREERRRELLLEMVNALGLTHKISSAELLRTYLPTFALETSQLAWLERMQRRAFLEEDLKKRGIEPPPWPIGGAVTSPANVAPISPPQQPTTPGGDGAQPSAVNIAPVAKR